MAATKVRGYMLSIKWGAKLIKGLETSGLKIKPNFEEILLKANNGVPTEELIDYDVELTFGGKTYERDTTEGPLAELDTLTVTGAATSGSNVTITLNAVPVTIAVLNGDSAIVCATKIRAGTYSGWTTGGTAGTTAVTFTKTLTGAVSAPVFSGGSTGCAASFVRTVTGQDATHEDFETLREAAAAGAEIAFVYGRFTSGEKIATGTGQIVDYSEDGNSKDTGTFSGSIKAKKGTVTFTTF